MLEPFVTINRLKSGMRTSLHCTLAWCLVMLVGIDMGLWLFSRAERPVLDDGPRLSAMKEFFISNSKPDIVLLGSSLAFAASYFCDATYVLKQDTTSSPDSNAYLKSMYFQHLLGHNLAKEPQVANFGFPGGMAADANVIASTLLQCGKHPRLLIYEMSPRDMIDNLVPLGSGSLGGALDHRSGTHDIATPHLIADSSWGGLWLRDLNRLGEHPSLNTLTNFYISSVWRFYKTKTNVKDWLVATCCQLLNREPTLYAAVNASSITKLYCGDPLFDHDIANYATRYNPPNFKQFALQKEQLKKLSELCVAANIKLVIVNMPISPNNKALINTAIYQQYTNELSALTKSRGCDFIELDDGNIFQAQDYRDSIHLNAQGGKKFQERLVEKLALSGSLKQFY